MPTQLSVSMVAKYATLRGLGFRVLGFRVLLVASVPIVRFRCFNSVLRFGRVLHAKKSL